MPDTVYPLVENWNIEEVGARMLDMAIAEIVGLQPGDTSAARAEIKRRLYRDAYNSIKASGGNVSGLRVPE